MVSMETLKEQFEEIGVDVPDSIIDKCKETTKFVVKVDLDFVYFFSWGLELCLNYNLSDPEEFVERWIAFSISDLNGAEPTAELIDEFENKEFRNQTAVKKETSKVDFKSRRDEQESEDEENKILGAYISITPKVSLDIRFSREFSLSPLDEVPHLWIKSQLAF